MLEVRAHEPSRPRVFRIGSRVEVERRGRDVHQPFVELGVRSPVTTGVEQRERIPQRPRRPAFLAVRAGEAEIARAVQRHERVAAVTLVIVSIVASHDKRGEGRLEIGELPTLHGVDDVEHLPADANASIAADSHLAAHVIADVAVARAERTPGAQDRGGVDAKAPPRREAIHDWPQRDRQSLNAVVRTGLHDTQCLDPIAFVVMAQTSQPPVAHAD